MPSAPGTIEPRLDRGDASITVAQAATGGAGGTVPRVRIWSWHLETAQNQRNTRVSPPFNGPAMILEMTFRWPHAADTRNWSLYWSNDDGGTLTAGVPTIKPSGTPIWETHTFVSAVGTVDRDEISENLTVPSNAADASTFAAMRPRYIIPTLDRFFLKVTAGGGNAGGSTFEGNMVIVEAATFDQLVNFP